MPDASEHSLPYIEFAGLKFGKLSVTDRTLLLRQYKAASRVELDADVTGLSAEQGYAEKRGHSDSIWGANRWMEYINQWDGQESAFRVALAKENPADKVDGLLAGLVLSPAESMELACRVSSYPYTPPGPPVPSSMKQVGVIDGKPVYAAVAAEGADGPNPTTTEATPPAKQGFGT